MPKALADGRTKLTALTTRPADMRSIQLSELTDGTDIECRIMHSDFRLSPTASDTITDEKELCAVGNPTVFGASNYEGSVTPFRYLDSDGHPDDDEDVAWPLLREKGTSLWLVKRTGPMHDEPWAAGDEIEVFEVITDTPQDPTTLSGFIKKVVPLGVQRAELAAVVASTGGGG